MRLKLKHITLSLSLLTLAVACKEQEEISFKTLSDGKTPIELSVGGIDANGIVTRASSSAVITQNENGMIAFPENTNIFMIMQSEYDEAHPDFTDPDNPHKVRTTIARGTVNKEGTAVSFDDVNKRYWDDAHARSTQLTIWAYAQMYKTDWTTCTFQKLVDDTKTGWEKYNDAVYFTKGNSNSYDWRQFDVYPGIKYWSVTHNPNGVQNETSILCQDLLFSNNIANNNDYNKGDNRLKFNFETRKFPERPQMFFRHAMSKITLHIKKGKGFTDNDDFSFTNKNVTLKGFNTQGAFNIKEGEFQYIWQHDEIPQIYQHTNADDGDAFTLDALCIPNIHEFIKTQPDGNGGTLKDEYSRFVKGKNNQPNDVMMQFTINNNTYKITSDALYDALMQHDGSGNQTEPATNATKKIGTGNDVSMGTYIPLEAGKHYHFTLTIGKTEIEHITAQLVPWEIVTASNYSPSNARINIQVEDRTNTIKETGLDIYRTNDNASDITDTWEHYDWFTGYKNDGNKATLAHDSETDKFTLNSNPVWYWDNNKTYYHFRSVQPANHEVNQGSTENGATEDEKTDYLKLTAGSTSSGTYYTDVKWGAPFKKFSDGTIDTDNEKFVYSIDYGFDGEKAGQTPPTHQIYKAIGPTPDPIIIIPFHMMSDVTINLETSDGDDAVNLTDATIDIVGVYRTGKVLMSNGKVIPTGDKSNETSPENILYNTTTGATPESAYRYGAIPQDLTGVSLIINTQDGNRYIVDMTKLYSKTEPPVTNHIKNPYTQTNGHYYINRWYPGFKYIYTLRLTKKGIDNFKATIVDWETITAENNNVQIQ